MCTDAGKAMKARLSGKNRACSRLQWGGLGAARAGRGARAALPWEHCALRQASTFLVACSVTPAKMGGV